MRAGVLSALPAAPPPSPAAEVDPELLRALRRILTATVSSAGLLTLELQVCGLPQLSLLVRSRSRAEVTGLAVWPTVLDRSEWHGGVLLVATAAAADAPRRAAVHSAALLTADRLTAEQRRLNAEQLASHAVELAGIDPLTGLGNRRTWRRVLDEEAVRAARYARSTAVVVVDLDGLKRINDGQGHAAGDAHLLRAATAVQQAARSVDVVCRLGGDEFGVLAPETAADGAVRLADRLRRQLDEAGVPASVGLATTESGELEHAWQLADQDMYRHKRSRGRGAG